MNEEMSLGMKRNGERYHVVCFYLHSSTLPPENSTDRLNTSSLA